VINNPKPNIEINLPDNLRITKSYNMLKITRNKKSNQEYNIPITEETLLPNSKTIRIIKETESNSNFYIRLNSKELTLPLYVRTRKDGDKMFIKNMDSSKKIKDIFINSKLSKEERDSQPIVVDKAGNILWLPGLKKSKFDKAKNENYDIILWYN
jgi:tRNA(Ile)-lysidine synthase